MGGRRKHRKHKTGNRKWKTENYLVEEDLGGREVETPKTENRQQETKNGKQTMKRKKRKQKTTWSRRSLVGGRRSV